MDNLGFSNLVNPQQGNNTHIFKSNRVSKMQMSILNPRHHLNPSVVCCCKLNN